MPPDDDDLGLDDADLDRIGELLAELEDADVERVEPPVDLWDRIEAGVAADRAPKAPPSPTVAPGSVVEYRIDADDMVAGVGQPWADFARDNHAPELAELPRGQVLWSYFDRDEVRELWQLLVRRVRTTQTAATVPLRCDAPQARRWFELTVTPQAAGTVHFRSALVFEEPRSPVTLLDPASARDTDAQPVPLCSWCGRGQHGEDWLDVESLVRERRLLEQPVMPPISYGICGSCRDEMSADVLVPGSTGDPAT